MLTGDSANIVRTSIGRSRTWARLGETCVQGYWRPVHPWVSCGLVSAHLRVIFQVLDQIRGLTSAALYFAGDTLVSDMVWALVGFAAWCCAAERNKVGTIKSKIAAVQYCHRVEVGMELPTKSPLLERVFSGISRAHAVAGTKSRVRRPMSRDMLLERETLVPS